MFFMFLEKMVVDGPFLTRLTFYGVNKQFPKFGLIRIVMNNTSLRSRENFVVVSRCIEYILLPPKLTPLRVSIEIGMS